MIENKKNNVLVVIQLTGGNDFMNTVVPYTNEHYYDARKTIVIKPDHVIPINDTLAFHENASRLKNLYDEGKVSIVQGIGYPNSNRSHFRGMDIWHTCEPDKLGTEGWLGLAIREMDPKQENVLTGINIGRGLPRAMSVIGVPVTSIGDIDKYGVMNDVEKLHIRDKSIQAFKNIYGQAIGTGPVNEYIGKTGLEILKGADMLADVVDSYSSSVEYGDNPIAKSLRDVARIYLANLGTRIFYTEHGGYDYHANEMLLHPGLLTDLSRAISDFMDDLEKHNAADNIAILIFTEFGRRMRDNGSGTDHGSGGGAFVIGKNVKGGLYAEYPSLIPTNWEHGEDLKHTFDFRGLYATILEQWLGVEAKPIVRKHFEQLEPFLNVRRIQDE